VDEKNKARLEKIFYPIVIALKTFTSWWVAPIWIFGLGCFLEQPMWLNVSMALVFGVVGWSAWKDTSIE